MSYVLCRCRTDPQCIAYLQYIDHETGKHSDRPQYQALFAAASRREFDLVLVWALDRFTRQGVADSFLAVRRLYDYGVKFESYTEPHFRSTGPAGDLMMAIAACARRAQTWRAILKAVLGVPNPGPYHGCLFISAGFLAGRNPNPRSVDPSE